MFPQTNTKTIAYAEYMDVLHDGFESRRNHERKTRGPPRNGGCADYKRSFMGFNGNAVLWCLLVSFSLFYLKFPHCFPTCFPIGFC